jgi:signal transduction histidine kinase
MNRPRLYWICFAIAALLGCAALAWLSRSLWQAEERRLATLEEADTQERVRLALWRVDFAVMGMVTKENARPAQDYKALSPIWNNLGVNYSVEKFPSPIIGDKTPEIRLHFEVDAENNLTSPQAPTDPKLLNYWLQAGSDRRGALEALPHACSPIHLREAVAAFPPAEAEPQVNWASLAPALNNGIRAAESSASQQALNVGETTRKGEIVSQIYGNSFNAAQAPDAPRVSTMRGLWLGKELFLARRVQSGAAQGMQGLWLDWERLRTNWKELIRDLLPEATFVPDLAPETPGSLAKTGRLAQLPVLLSPGTLLRPPVTTAPALRRLLIGSWSAAGVAVLALGLLLSRSLALSERRGAFVSAVTHELRTPLTTFRLYTDMLASGIVTSPEHRDEYLRTLGQEASRLDHLVENVLAFAKLERGSARSRHESGTVSSILGNLSNRLAERALRGGLELQTTLPKDAEAMPWTVDVTSLGQILTNLVENAVKYAPGSGTLSLSAQRHGRKLEICLSDLGPGIPAQARRHLFKPFHKSADDAACGASGIGLGLSLSRRLARGLRGDLRYVENTPHGSRFTVELPF